MMTMRKLTAITAVLMLALAGTALANALDNPGFETGDLTAWQSLGGNASATISVVSDNGPSAAGSHCAYMANFGQAVGLTLKQTTVPGTAIGGLVTWTFDLKLGQAGLGGVFFVQIFAEQSGVGIVGGSGLLGNYAPAGWQTFTGSFMAPPGTDFLTIQFMANTGAVVGGSSTMYVDNVKLEQEGIVADEATTWGGIKGLFR